MKQILYRYPKCAPFEREAVESAVLATQTMDNAQERLKVISLVYFKKTHKLVGAAMQIPCSYQTAKDWQQAFIREMAKRIKCDGLLKE